MLRWFSKKIDIDKVIFENIDTDTELSRDFWINIKKEILENINIDKEILQNIDIDKILYGFRIWHIEQGYYPQGNTLSTC